MKTRLFTFVLLFVISNTAFAQATKLSPDASTLFKEVTSKLTNQEKNTITSLSQLVLDTQNQSIYKTTDTGENKEPLDVSVYVFDLTSDGVEEVGIIYHPKADADKKEVASMLFVQNKGGQYQLNLDVPGQFYFLDVNTLVFPDIYVRNYKVGLPVYRWDGNQYNKHKPLKPGKLKKYTVTDMARASRMHNGSTIGE